LGLSTYLSCIGMTEKMNLKPPAIEGDKNEKGGGWQAKSETDFAYPKSVTAKKHSREQRQENGGHCVRKTR